jgi:hypothetical protein
LFVNAHGRSDPSGRRFRAKNPPRTTHSGGVSTKLVVVEEADDRGQLAGPGEPPVARRRHATHRLVERLDREAGLGRDPRRDLVRRAVGGRVVHHDRGDRPAIRPLCGDASQRPLEPLGPVERRDRQGDRRSAHRDASPAAR